MEVTEGVAAQAERVTVEKQLAVIEHHEKIRALAGVGNLTEALSLCDTALALDAANADSLFLKALVLYRLGEHRLAEPLVIEAFAINSFSIEYYTLLSAIYLHKRQLEEANLVADQGLAYQGGHLPTLQLKAVALIRLFRLQEAHTVIQKMQRLRQESVVPQDDLTMTGDDPEVLMEQALTVDPFKTKSRLESLDSIKAQTGAFRLVKGVMFAERNNTIIGLGIIAGAVMAIAYFFRDSGTYKAFTMLIVSVLMAVTGQKNALSVSTNAPLFLPREFRRFLQQTDVRMAVRGMIAMTIMVASFFVWHYMKSFVALGAAVFAAAYFTLLQEKFPDGRSLANFKIPKPKRKKKEEAQKVEITTIPLEQVPYATLYNVLRRDFPGKKLLAKMVSGTALLSGLLFVLVYPLIFLTLRLSGVLLSYKVLVIPELAAVFVMQLPFMMGHISDLPVFFPRGARRFIPGSARRRASLRLLVAVLFLGSVAAWLVLDNAHVLWASGLLLFMMVRNIFSLKKTKSADYAEGETTPSKDELIAYVKQHHKAFKNVEATQSLTAVSAEDSAAQR